MKTKHFVGRKTELKQLHDLNAQKGAHLVVLKGRRRIGKSRLAKEFCCLEKGYKTVSITAQPPHSSISAKDEREDFAEQLGRALSIPPPRADSWNNLFWSLTSLFSKGKWILLLDEINWMGSSDPQFLGSLKNAWDQHFSHANNLMIILSGSLTSWIERNILHDTGFVGRIDLDITLGELALKECSEFWGNRSCRITAHEKFKILAVTGGIPRYLESVLPGKSSNENIKRLCFDPSGLLYREFDDLFNDLFSKRNSLYRKIIEKISDGVKDMDSLHHALDLKKSGVLAGYIDELSQCGLLSRDYTWKIINTKESRLSQFRICDNYIKFYLKGIVPHRSKIANKTFDLPINLDSLLGLQFENIVLNNRQSIWAALGLASKDIVVDNPFFQRKTVRQKGCQIDYMIQIKQNTLYVCEIKFKSEALGKNIINEVQRKIDSLSAPRNFSIRPILIHVNGVKQSVIDEDYFDEIIDLGQLL